jgi:hypothetical protein
MLQVVILPGPPLPNLKSPLNGDLNPCFTCRPVSYAACPHDSVCLVELETQRELFADGCGQECSNAIAYYQTNDCPADTFAGREVANIRRDLAALAWSVCVARCVCGGGGSAYGRAWVPVCTCGRPAGHNLNRVLQVDRLFALTGGDREQGEDPPTPADVEAALRTKYRTATICQTGEAVQCPAAFGCCPNDGDELPPYC